MAVACILRLVGMALETRGALPGLEPQRAEVIVARAVILAEARGIRWGSRWRVALERLAVARGGAV